MRIDRVDKLALNLLPLQNQEGQPLDGLGLGVQEGDQMRVMRLPARMSLVHLGQGLADLPDGVARNANLPDAAPATDANRTIKPEWFVSSGVCTHLGCTPTISTPTDVQGEYGGWLCHCHGSQYDTAGRIRKGPAPRNLQVPVYSFLSDTRIKVG